MYLFIIEENSFKTVILIIRKHVNMGTIEKEEINNLIRLIFSIHHISIYSLT